MSTRLRITVHGAVQGTGFRPFVHRLATDLALGGFVRNRGAAVEIEAEGAAPQALARELGVGLPPGAAVSHIECAELAPVGERTFRIAASLGEPSPAPARTLADRTTCEACLADLANPDSRYFRYPFTNCSHCGPRYSIQQAVPYDRANTTMRDFPLCSDCQYDYENPVGRRFHAQPVACAHCGPTLTFEPGAGGTIRLTGQAANEAAIAAAAAAICSGRIIALKGLGGFQLLVDAQNPDAIARLRERKHRPSRPLAVMVHDLAAARCHAIIDATEAELLLSAAGPIVLLEGIPGTLPDGIAPGLGTVGLMLPTTPLHHLLLEAVGGPVVCTSGNRSAEPIAIDEVDAHERLEGIADAWLGHDRRIWRPLDDSVARVIGGKPQWLRVARGRAPTILPFPASAPLLASGSAQKNTLALAGSGQLVVTQHLGDLDDARSMDAMLRTGAELAVFHGITPRLRVIDGHPDCPAANAPLLRALATHRVPHHLAHALAVMLEHELRGPLLAVVWDGNGYGSDGTSWGGEFLVVDASGPARWRRAAHIKPFTLPGGDAAAREPLRALAGLRWQIAGLHRHVPETLRRLLARGINAPATTSAGRLFDGIAALAGFTGPQHWDGEAATWLEHSAAGLGAEPYPLPLEDCILDWAPLLIAAENDRALGRGAGIISARFHAALAEAIVNVARREGFEAVVLTGGCFQNRLLSELATSALERAGFTAFLARQLPPNDGSIAAGQALGAALGPFTEMTR